jgi:hypothetical protein
MVTKNKDDVQVANLESFNFTMRMSDNEVYQVKGMSLYGLVKYWIENCVTDGYFFQYYPKQKQLLESALEANPILELVLTGGGTLTLHENLPCGFIEL